MKQEPDIQLRYDNYIGRFYKRTKPSTRYHFGRWLKFDQVGNTGEAFHFAEMLGKLGHVVEFVDEIVEERQ